MIRCRVCGKPIGDAAPGIRFYATLVSYDEYLGLAECGKTKICSECWHKLIERAEEVKKILEGEGHG